MCPRQAPQPLPSKRAPSKHPPRTALHQGVCTHLPRRVGGMCGSYGHGLDRYFTCMHRMVVCLCPRQAPRPLPSKRALFKHPPRTALHQGICTHLPRRAMGMYGPCGHGLGRFFTCMHRAVFCFVYLQRTSQCAFGGSPVLFVPISLGDQGCGSGTGLSTALVFVHCGIRDICLDCGAFFVDTPMGCLLHSGAVACFRAC